MEGKNKIGIVTFFKGNYGSILQCYATCSILKKLDFFPCVINLKVSRISNLFRMAKRCLQHPRHIKTFYNIRRKAFSGGNKILQEDSEAMASFVESELPVFTVSASKLHAMGKSNDFIFFLSGSDQIWGGHEYIVDFTRFLRFAPQSKRIAWAPSFGTTDIADYNKKSYRKYISQYKALSVRETSAVHIIEELTGKTPTVLIDPVYLLTRNEWLEFAPDILPDKYILCYFLDEPSALAMNQIDYYCDINHTKVILFGPWNQAYSEIAAEHLHGGPKTFVSLIAHADCVFTDSFHALSFSLIMNTPFWVYRRNYLHGIDQSSRVVSILEKVNMLQYFEPQSGCDQNWDFSVANSIIEKERNAMIEYLHPYVDNCVGGGMNEIG